MKLANTFNRPKAAVALIAVMALTAAACSDDGVVVATTAVETGQSGEGQTQAEVSAVEVIGDDLVQPPRDASADPGLGAVAPTLRGTDINGESIEIGPDGRPKAVVFVAHWCPHCQDEVPVLTDLISQGELPAEMDLYVVSTAVFDDRENYPPSAWLTDSGIDAPIMLDSEEFEALIAYGGGGFPFTVYLDSENRVLKRTQGTASPELIKTLWLETAAS